jgi:hypothetical protein
MLSPEFLLGSTIGLIVVGFIVALVARVLSGLFGKSAVGVVIRFPAGLVLFVPWFVAGLISLLIAVIWDALTHGGDGVAGWVSSPGGGAGSGLTGAVNGAIWKGGEFLILGAVKPPETSDVYFRRGNSESGPGVVVIVIVLLLIGLAAYSILTAATRQTSPGASSMNASAALT